MAEPLHFGRVVDNVGSVESVAKRPDVQQGIVQIAAKLDEIEQSETDSILQDGEVGSLLGGQLIGIELFEALAEVFVEPPLVVDGGRAKVVQWFVQHLPFILVQ